MKKQRIVVVGAGIAGSMITAGLRGLPNLDLICIERATTADHAEAGTGLNIGPNAIKALSLHLPEIAQTILSNSIPWESWKVSLTDGTMLMDLPLSEVADNPGIRIRWAELYSLLRFPLADTIRYGTELIECGRGENGPYLIWKDPSGKTERIEDIDLLIAGDGRYSLIREFVLGGPEMPYFLGVCLYRVLFPAGPDCPIDDYEQWFNGPNRLLAFKVPGDFVYLAGSFPIPSNGAVTDAMKTPEFLRSLYLPREGAPSAQVAYLIEKIQQHADRIHWARLQEGSVAYGQEPEILLVGDSAHPMVPTLGQGATQACEDACVVVDEIKQVLDEGASLRSVPDRVEARRADRVRFVVQFSRDATDTMLEGADPVEGTKNKLEAPFQQRLTRLYRDVPLPHAMSSQSNCSD